MLYLPTLGFDSDIDTSASARETIIQNLVQNQQRMGHQIDQLREILFIASARTLIARRS